MGKTAHLAKHQFKAGNPGGPGRQLGSRNRLSETMLALLNSDAAEHGAAVIEEVRKTKPHIWLQCVCSLLPKQIAVEKLSPLADISDEDLAAITELLRQKNAKTVRELKKLEQQSGAVLELEANVADSDTEDKIIDSSSVER
jgi:hypothetical protein